MTDGADELGRLEAAEIGVSLRKDGKILNMLRSDAADGSTQASSLDRWWCDLWRRRTWSRSELGSKDDEDLVTRFPCTAAVLSSTRSHDLLLPRDK